MDNCTGENKGGIAGWELRIQRNTQELWVPKAGQWLTQTATLQPWTAPSRKLEA